MGRPSLAPGRYFRLLLVGYFEGIDSERGMGVARDGLVGGPAAFCCGWPWDEAPPDSFDDCRARGA